MTAHHTLNPLAAETGDCNLSAHPIRLIVVAILLGASVLRAELPPEAQSAMDKGVLAAQQQDFALAARFFAEARELAPEAPELLYNLGLAESKIPGRELRAIAWFGAYLAANPAAPNAKAVRKQMDALDVTSQVNVSRFIKTTADAAKLVPNPDRQQPALISSGFYQGGSLHYAVILLARNGNTAEALKTADGIESPFLKSRAQGVVGLILAAAGDKKGAQKCYDLALRTGKSAGIAWYLALNQAWDGEIEAALKTVESMPGNDMPSCDAKCAIAKAMIEKGDIPAAKRLLGEVEQTARHLNDGTRDAYGNIFHNKSSTYQSVSQAYIQAGDLKAARNAVDLIDDASYKKPALSAIAEAETPKREASWYSLAKSGNFTEALQAVDKIGNERDAALRSVASLQARSGSLGGALKTISLMKTSYAKGRAHWMLAEIRPEKQMPGSAEDWIILNTEVLSEPLYTEYASALATLPKGSAKETFDALHDTGTELLYVRKLVTQMLKLQSAKRTGS